MITRLLSGAFEAEQKLDEGGASIEKKAMLVYTGSFESLDGPVDITDEDLTKLAENHNGFLAKMSRLAGGGTPLKFAPPIQLDHSTSAKDTVGRLVGNLELGTHKLEDGTEVKALMGNVKILGKENVEKVQDGRWTHLSIGADLSSHKITELTITPFPAAAEASLLNRMGKVFDGKVLGVPYAIYKEGGRYYWSIKGYGQSGKMHDKENAANIEAEQVIRDLVKKGELKQMSEEADRARLGWEEYTYQGPTKKFTLVLRDDDIRRVKVEVDGKTSQVFSLDRHPTDGPIKELIPEIEKKSGFKLGVDAHLSRQIYKGAVIDTKEVGGGKWNAIVEVDGAGEELPLKANSNADAFRQAKKWLDEHMDEDELSKGEDEMPTYKEMKEKMEMYAKCKQHLMDKEKLSEEDAEKKLSEMADDEVTSMAAAHDEKMKQMAADEDAKKKELEDKKAEMSAKTESLKKLAAGFKATQEKVQLAAKKSRIQARLSKLKAEAKITPAEIRRLRVDELAGKSDEAIEAALSTYESREAVVHTGMVGTIKAMTPSEMANSLKSLRMSRLELETMMNMPSKREEAIKRLAALQEEEKEVNIHIDNVPQGEHDTEMSDYDKMMDECSKLMDEGKMEDAKAKMKEYGERMKKMKVPADTSMGDAQAEMNELAEEVKKMQDGFNAFVKMTAASLGVDETELI